MTTREAAPPILLSASRSKRGLANLHGLHSVPRNSCSSKVGERRSGKSIRKPLIQDRPSAGSLWIARDRDWLQRENGELGRKDYRTAHELGVGLWCYHDQISQLPTPRPQQHIERPQTEPPMPPDRQIFLVADSTESLAA